jgi:glutamate-1-semialdehyde 2,1-aminomutase
MLDRGVYFPPSQFEAAFVSAVHGPEEIAATLRAVKESLAA